MTKNSERPLESMLCWNEYEQLQIETHWDFEKYQNMG